jgi:hypothetical protein
MSKSGLQTLPKVRRSPKGTVTTLPAENNELMKTPKAAEHRPLYDNEFRPM